jgi:outer membrane receptor protein involved in Fe transport
MLGPISAVRSACISVVACALAPIAYAQTDPHIVDFDIPAQPLNAALVAFSRQSGTQVSASAEAVDGKTAAPVFGELSAEQALSLLLVGTGLKAKSSTDRSFVIATVEVNRAERTRASEQPNSTVPAPPPTSDKSAPVRAPRKETETKSNRRSRDQSGSSARLSNDAGGLETVIVTAQKREERLQDVPVPVSAINTGELAQLGQLRLQEFYTHLPGLNLAAGFGGASTIAVRGITTTSLQNPGVGVVIDDVPYSYTIAGGFPFLVPDVNPGELSRIELLRGPQGTLYGASSIGGVLKFVTIDPSPIQMDGSLAATFSKVVDGDDVGYGIRGAINLPLGSETAMRVSGFTGEDPGYLDNVQSGERDANARDYHGGQLAFLWKPSELFSVKAKALIQESERPEGSEVDSRLGSGEFQYRGLSNTGGFGRRLQAYSMNAEGTVRGATVTSVTGYNVDEISSRNDFSVLTFFRNRASALFGVSGVVQPYSQETRKFSQEVRVALPVSKSTEWLIGAFYTDEDAPKLAPFVAADSVTSTDVGELVAIRTSNGYEEVAVFTNLTRTFSDQFEVQLGGRFNENKQTFEATRTGLIAAALFGSNPSIVPTLRSDDSSATYSIVSRLRTTQDTMVYARISSGYRPGSINTSCGAPGVPCKYDADTTQNYELGFKGSFPRLGTAVDASVYNIEWKDVPVTLRAPISSLIYFGNAGRARSRGVEISVDTVIRERTSLSGWLTITDAELAENAPPGSTFVARSGDRLPFSPRISGRLAVDHEFPLWENATVTIGSAASYVGERKGIFRPSVTRSVFPSYVQVDGHARFGFGSWSMGVFVNNLTDRRGVLRAQFDSTDPSFVTYITPRTAGISISRAF